jgi:DNA-binding transcriptional MerR regulator
MPTKRTLDQIKDRDFLKLSELAELCGVRYSTVKFYSEMGLIPFQQQGPRLAKYYPQAEASARLKEILRMREQGKSVPDIITHILKK